MVTVPGGYGGSGYPSGAQVYGSGAKVQGKPFAYTLNGKYYTQNGDEVMIAKKLPASITY